MYKLKSKSVKSIDYYTSSKSVEIVFSAPRIGGNIQRKSDVVFRMSLKAMILSKKSALEGILEAATARMYVSSRKELRNVFPVILV